MSLLNDLININLSDTTEKIIAEYLWYLLSFSFVYDHIYDHQVTSPLLKLFFFPLCV